MPDHCPFGEYYDSAIGRCQSCADDCGRTVVFNEEKHLFCGKHCPLYVRSEDEIMSDSREDSLPSSLVWFPAVTFVLIVILIALLVIVVCIRRVIIKSKDSDSDLFVQNERLLQLPDVNPPSLQPVRSNEDLASFSPSTCHAMSAGGITSASNHRVASASAAGDAEEDLLVIEPASSFVGNPIDSPSTTFNLRASSPSASPVYPNETVVDFSSGARRVSTVNLVSSEFEGRLKMFGWLNSQPWVTQYFEGPNGVEIAVESIDHTVARDQIRQAAAMFVSEFEFCIIPPVGGSYIPCPVTSPSSLFLMHEDGCFFLSPGAQLYSPRMEPVDAGEPVVGGYAMYAGCIRGSCFGEFGLTVGHLFDAVGTECHRRAMPWLPVSITVGKCAFKADHVDLVHSIRRTTADLALIRLGCPSQNVVQIQGCNFRLRLYRGVLDIRKIVKVAIVTKDGAVRYGQVNNFLFTIDKLGLYNTMSIVDIERQSTRLNDCGDSGALVTSIPRENGDVLFVYGMVIGYYESRDGLQSNTVATRLWDVLNSIAGNSKDLDFADFHPDCQTAAAAPGYLAPTSSESDNADAAESGYATFPN